MGILRRGIFFISIRSHIHDTISNVGINIHRLLILVGFYRPLYLYNFFLCCRWYHTSTSLYISSVIFRDLDIVTEPSCTVLRVLTFIGEILVYIHIVLNSSPPPPLLHTHTDTHIYINTRFLVFQIFFMWDRTIATNVWTPYPHDSTPLKVKKKIHEHVINIKNGGSILIKYYNSFFPLIFTIRWVNNWFFFLKPIFLTTLSSMSMDTDHF